MIEELDLILEELREPEPFDEAFVRAVMQDVATDELRRSRRRMLRRPTVTMIAVAALVTGGAVAAVVGSNPSRPGTPERPSASATIVAIEDPSAEAPKAAAKAGLRDDAVPKVADLPPKGYTTDHTSYITDAETGLHLVTETYTNQFRVGKAHRVTMTLSNTGKYPISISAAKGCGMQVMAYPAGDRADAKGFDPATYNGDLAWMCAGSGADPRTPATDERYVLAPGERRTADSFVTLDRAGEWSLIGACRCSYTQMGPTPVPKSDPIGDITRRALPAPLLPEQPDGENLSTPPIRVYAS